MPDSSIAHMDDADPHLTRKVDAIRSLLAETHIRGIGEQRRERRREIDIRDAADRIGVAFAQAGHPLPDQAFLMEHATRILDAYDGVTREPLKVAR